MMQIDQEERKLLAQLKISEDQNKREVIKADTERYAKRAELQMDHHDMSHRHLREALETHHRALETRHKISQSQTQGI